MRFWDEQLKLARAETKKRIAIYEKKGIGINTMEEKAILKRIERKQELRKQNGQ